MKCFLITICFILGVQAENSGSQLKLTSTHIKQHNPLLPKLEPKLWAELIDAEAEMKDPARYDKAKAVFIEIAAQLTRLHKLERNESKMVLGGVCWNRKENTIFIPAKLRYPNPGMPLEALLCQPKGRVHETLFLTNTRPLHLEVILHMAGVKRGDLLEMEVKSSSDSRRIENFLRWKGKGNEILKWKFTGSEFGEVYIPDNAGEQIIIWSRNEAVLEIANRDFTSLKVPLYAEEVKDFPKDTEISLVLKIKK